MNELKLGLTDQPVAYSVLAKALVALVVLLGVVDWSPEQVAGVLTVVDALLGVLVFQAVTPKPVVAAQVEDATLRSIAFGRQIAAPPPPKKAAAKKASR